MSAEVATPSPTEGNFRCPPLSNHPAKSKTSVGMEALHDSTLKALGGEEKLHVALPRLQAHSENATEAKADPPTAGATFQSGLDFPVEH